MYETILFVHSWWRWVVIISLLVVFIKATNGWIKSSTYNKSDKIWGGILIGSVHLQLLIGFILYFGLSPIVSSALANMGFAMKSASLRYWAVEHFLSIIIFATIVQLGRTLSKRSREDLKKHKRMAISTGVGILILIATMPWPFRKEIGRPLFADYPNKSQLIANPE